MKRTVEALDKTNLLIPMLRTRMPRRTSRVAAGPVARLAILFVFLTIARAIDLTSFRTPYARVTTNDVSFYSGSDLLSSTVSDTPYSRSEFRVGPAWHWFTQTQSDPRNWSLDGRFDLSWYGYQELWHSERQASRELRGTEEVSLAWQEYLGRSDFLVSFAPDIMLNPTARFDSGLTVIGAGCNGWGELDIGYGRFRDAWPLAKAIRLVSILRDCGVLENEPKEGQLMELADFISSSWRLFYAHDRAAKFYYDSLEVILLEDRVIREPLPAYVLMNLDDALTVGFDEREFGSQVIVGTSADFLDEFSYTPARGHGNATTHNYFKKPGVPHPTAEYQYARPIGLRWSTAADFKYELAPAADTPTHTLNIGMTGSYQVSNRLLADVNLTFSARGRHALGTFANPTVSATGGLSGSFHYYLADRLILTASLGVVRSGPLVGLAMLQPQSRVSFGFGLGAGPQWLYEPTPMFEP